MQKQKFDMHTHSKEGSFDAHVPIDEFARKLKKKGFAGMIVTDHDSYDGYYHYLHNKDKLNFPNDFIILKGIEYSTTNAGHFICIMPDDYETNFLTIKGLSAARLEEEVHKRGGILGPAHPYMPGTWAFCNTKFGRNNMDFLKRVDFIETYNSTINPMYNVKAEILATRFKKPATGGSDAHHLKDVGAGFVMFGYGNIACNNDLIEAIKSKKKNVTGGEITALMLKRRNDFFQKVMDASYHVYNVYTARKNKKRLNEFEQNIHQFNI